MSGVKAWADDLRWAADEVLNEAQRVVSKGAYNIKSDWRDRWRNHPRIRHLPFTITYDLHRDDAAVTASAVIGPEYDKSQGPLGNIIEYGTLHSAPIPGGAPAMAAEEPRFVKAIGDLAEKLLLGDRR